MSLKGDEGQDIVHRRHGADIPQWNDGHERIFGDM